MWIKEATKIHNLKNVSQCFYVDLHHDSLIKTKKATKILDVIACGMRVSFFIFLKFFETNSRNSWKIYVMKVMKHLKKFMRTPLGPHLRARCVSLNMSHEMSFFDAFCSNNIAHQITTIEKNNLQQKTNALWDNTLCCDVCICSFLSRSLKHTIVKKRVRKKGLVTNGL